MGGENGCGRVVGHGDSCSRGWLCDQCSEVVSLEQQLARSQERNAELIEEFGKERVTLTQAVVDIAEVKVHIVHPILLVW